MSFVIQTIPMPDRKVVTPIGRKGSKYPLGDLQIGQCIVLDGIDPKKDHSKLSSAVANFRKANPASDAKFGIRTFTVDEDGVTKTKVGVWRVEPKAADASADAAQG